LLLGAVTGFAQRPELFVQTGHTRSVSTIALTRDGKVLVTGGNDATIRFWDVVTGRELRRLRLHAIDVVCVALSHDDKQLASLDSDRNLKIWDVATGEVLHTTTLTLSANMVVFSSDGKSLVVAGKLYSFLGVWDTQTGLELHSFSGHGDATNVALSPDGKLVAFTVEDKTIRPLYGVDKSKITSMPTEVWDVATGRQLRTIRDDTHLAIAFAPDDNVLAISRLNGVELWSLATGQRLSVLTGHTNDWLAFSPDGNTLAGGGYQDCTLWDVRTGQEIRNYKEHLGSIAGGALSTDGKVLATAAGDDLTVDVGDVAQGRQLNILGGRGYVNTVAFNVDGMMLVKKVDKRETISVWDIAFGRNLRGYSWNSSQASQLGFSAASRFAFSPDGSTLATIDPITLWDVATGRMLQTYDPTHHAFGVMFSPDSKTFLSTEGSTANLWELGSGTPKSFGSDTICGLSFSRDGKTIITGYPSKKVEIWEVATGAKLRSVQFPQGQGSFGNPKDAFSKFAFSPDGQTAAGAEDYDESAKLLDIKSGRELHTLGLRYGAAHYNPITALEFSADSATLVTGSYDGTIKLWSVANGRELKILKGHADAVTSLAFSTDGKLLASVSQDSIIKLWELTTGQELISVIAADEQDWLAVTPDGLFDGSPAAWNQILWRFSKSLFDVAPVEGFFNEFYYPDLLTDILQGKRPRATAAISKKDRRQPHLTLSVAERNSAPANPATQTVTGQKGVKGSQGALDQTAPVPQPSPTPDSLEASMANLERIRAKLNGRFGQPIESLNKPVAPTSIGPPVGSESSTRIINVKIEITSPLAGAQDVRLFRNGSLVKVWHGDVLKGKSAATLDATIRIVAGENRLTAYAFNHDNIKSSDATLTVNGADNLRRKGLAYVLAVGVNEYTNSQYNLKYAVADAQDFGEELKRQQTKLNNYDRVEVISLNDKDATKANILKALADLSAKVQPEDALVIFFAGHGTAQQNRFYLIPHDLGYAGSRTELDSPALQKILAHSISDEEISRAVEGIDAGQMLLVIDACNSGQALEAEEKRRGPMNSKGLAQLAYEKGMYILTAAQSYQAANEAERYGHGFLTYALVEEGLKTGAADKEPQDGQVLLREWLDFATERVPQMQQDKLEEQQKQGRQLDRIKFAEADSGKERSIQRPRVFYRREAETHPLVVARP
jgi:WD40 repeat protein/uncharacterized caspase-like protein